MSYQQFGHVDRDERIELAADEPMGESPRWNIVPKPLVNVLVMAAFAGGLYFAYVQGTHHPVTTPPAASPAQQAARPTGIAGQQPATPAVVAQNPPPPDNVPLIKADPQPIKVKPEQPGGLVVPDRNMMIYNERPGGPPAEKLLPPPEQPEARPAAPPRAPVAAVPHQQVAMAPQVAPGPPGARLFTPEPIAPRAAPAARPAPPAALGADKGGHIRIVVASLRTPDEARAEWQRLKKASPDILGKMTADAVRADLGDKGIWYRIEAGSFAQPTAAERVCRELKARHLGCSVVR
jgi:hypothetical protein